MRLLIATPLYPPDIGGPATDSSALAAFLHEHGEEVRVVSFSSVRRWPVLIRHGLYLYRLLRNGRGADALISFDTFSVALPAYMAARLLHLPYIVRVPGDYAWEQGTQRFGVTDSIETFQHKRYGLSVELLRALQRFVLRRANLVLVISDFFRGIISSWGIDPTKVRRIYLGLPMEDEPIELPEKGSKKVIFSFGRFVPWKGFRLLVDLLSELPSWELVIAGDGPDRRNIEIRAKTRGVIDRIHLPGRLSRESILGWLRSADAFVLNTFQENFSYQVLEGMKEGAAIITTHVGSLPELITDGVEGVLCAPNDREAFLAAIRSTQTEPEGGRADREAARRKAREFSIERSAQETADAIRSICASSS